MKKIYVIGNVFFIEDENGNLKSEIKALVLVRKSTLTSTKYSFLFDNQVADTIEFANIQDENGDAFASQSAFETFAYDNTGFNSASGGSGARFFGLFDYNDQNTSTNPINITGGVGFIDLTNDTLGSFTNTSYPPYNLDSIFNPVTNNFDFSPISLGSKIDIRLDIEVTTLTPNTQIQGVLNLGIGSNPYDIQWFDRFEKSSGIHPIVVSNFVYIGDTNTKNNPAKFKIQSDENITVKVNGWACYVFLY